MTMGKPKGRDVRVCLGPCGQTKHVELFKKSLTAWGPIYSKGCLRCIAAAHHAEAMAQYHADWKEMTI